jgi:hypothetical protein
LLDWLATRFLDDGYSLKKLIRLIVTSRTWQLSSRASEKSRQVDPNNRLLSHANVRRLEAEAIRDSLLALSGQLDHRLQGPPVDGSSSRRSVYVRVIRNSLDPFLRSFDFPEPFSSTGRRDATNVPAQSLTLMNDQRVSGYASAWANRVLSDSTLVNEAERIRWMFLTAFGRPAAEEEVARAARFLEATRRSLRRRQRQFAELQTQIAARRKDIDRLHVSAEQVMVELTADERVSLERLNLEIQKLEAEQESLGPMPNVVDHVAVWTDLAQALFTFQELIYVR